jgi:UPF0755 protein
VALSRGSKWFLVSCLVAVVAIGGGLLYLSGELGGGASVEAGQPVEIDVAPGTSVRALANHLAEQGVVRRAGSFLNAASDAQLDQHLQPGGYDLETGMGNDEAVQAFLDGPDRTNVVRVTVPEGLPVEVILERLAEGFEDRTVDDFRAVLDERTEAGENAEGLLALPDWVREPADAGDEIIEPYEGLLFPETYEFEPDRSPREVLQRLIDQTDRVMERSLAEIETDLEPYEILIKASLIERETRVDAERPRVAGVVQNRIEAGMRLQIDASVLYAKGEHTAIVLLDDLDIDSPYNTYNIDGLPPAPIAAPGEAAVRATLDPEDHDFLFYVLAPECDGSHQFAEDDAGHQRNVAEFRDANRCQ